MFGLPSIYVPPSDGRSRGVSVDLRRRNVVNAKSNSLIVILSAVFCWSIGSLDHRLSSPYAGGEGGVRPQSPSPLISGFGEQSINNSSMGPRAFPAWISTIG
ncbi:hypothetical protein GPALN_011007 [Globodera pallida]|nr:hypothetical protein GPALN_011007 [Globodera pallida]